MGKVVKNALRLKMELYTLIAFKKNVSLMTIKQKESSHYQPINLT